jgi:hypothetical protein
MEILSDRISVVRKDDLTSIVISAVASRKKNRFIAGLLILWIVGGAVMVYSFSSLEGDKTKIVVFIWFAFWLYFLYVLFRLWRWKQYGHEVIKISNGTLKYKKDVKGRGWVNDYKLEHVKKLRESLAETPGWVKNFGGDFWNTDCDSIRFDYEDREIALGHQLEQKEKDKLLAVLGEFVPLEEKASKRSQKTNPKL